MLLGIGCSLTLWRGSERVGPALGGAGVGVACGQGPGDGGRSGIVRVTCPAQRELQRGPLREGLERGQPLSNVYFMFIFLYYVLMGFL